MKIFLVIALLVAAVAARENFLETPEDAAAVGQQDKQILSDLIGNESAVEDNSEETDDDDELALTEQNDDEDEDDESTELAPLSEEIDTVTEEEDEINDLSGDGRRRGGNGRGGNRRGGNRRGGNRRGGNRRGGNRRGGNRRGGNRRGGNRRGGNRRGGNRRGGNRRGGNRRGGNRHGGSRLVSVPINNRAQANRNGVLVGVKTVNFNAVAAVNARRHGNGRRV